MNGDNDDKTKWTFKKGTGSCAVCKDALAIRFGPTCEGKNSDCKHCQGIIDAYKDCDGESQECKDAKAITHVNEQSDDDAGIYTGQCYHVNMNGDNDDKTKWTFKKGTGSCAVCKDALAIRFGPTCEGKNSDCKHCQGIIDAYKDCSSDSTPDTDSKTDDASSTPSSAGEDFVFDDDDSLSAADDRRGWRGTVVIVIFSIAVVLHALM